MRGFRMPLLGGPGGCSKCPTLSKDGEREAPDMTHTRLIPTMSYEAAFSSPQHGHKHEQRGGPHPQVFCPLNHEIRLCFEVSKFGVFSAEGPETPAIAQGLRLPLPDASQIAPQFPKGTMSGAMGPVCL